MANWSVSFSVSKLVSDSLSLRSILLLFCDRGEDTPVEDDDEKDSSVVSSSISWAPAIVLRSALSNLLLPRDLFGNRSFLHLFLFIFSIIMD